MVIRREKGAEGTALRTFQDLDEVKFECSQFNIRSMFGAWYSRSCLTLKTGLRANVC